MTQNNATKLTPETCCMLPGPKNDIIAHYSALARTGVAAHGSGSAYATLEGIPEGAHLGLGTGDPVRIAAPQPGETLLDLGSGAGVDVFLSARAVGPTGRAIGVDASPDMVARAQRLANENGITNVEFHNANIEKLPLPDASVDAIVSNCVVNLATNKTAVLKEAHRVLRNGGRLIISDTRRIDNAPDRAPTCDCVGGALTLEEWQQMLPQAGFHDIHIDAIENDGCCGARLLVQARRN